MRLEFRVRMTDPCGETFTMATFSSRREAFELRSDYPGSWVESFHPSTGWEVL